MTSYTCLIVDDEPMAIAVIESYVEKLDYLNLIGTSRNAIAALNKLRHQKLIFCFLIFICLK